MPPPVRIRDAATLILVRRDPSRRELPRLLMGRRHRDHRFMPDKFVFPGGRVDPGDARVAALAELRPDVEKRLIVDSPATRARALALAAVRETFEETGLALGRPIERPPRTRSLAWRSFFSQGLSPDLSVLELVARAITPPGQPARYDTRFFMADARHASGPVTGSGELLDLRWVGLDEARSLDLPEVTRLVIDELEQRLALPDESARTRGVPFVRYTRGRPRLDYL